MPKLTEDLIPGVVTLTTLHKVLQNLLDEKVPIRDPRRSRNAGGTCAHPEELQQSINRRRARVALGRAVPSSRFLAKMESSVLGLRYTAGTFVLQALQGGGGLEGQEG